MANIDYTVQDYLHYYLDLGEEEVIVDRIGLVAEAEAEAEAEVVLLVFLNWLLHLV